MKESLRLSRLAKSSFVSRDEIYHFYINKYYNLFMNSYIWEGIDYQQRDFIMRKLWSDGKVACFKIKGTEGSKDYPNGMIGFCPYAPISFNIYDYPVEVTLINIRGVKFIPSTPQKVDKDVAIGYCQRNKKSVFNMVDFYVRKITDVEMTIRTNLKVQKTPWLIGITPENESKKSQMVDNLESDNPTLFVDLEDVNSAKALVSGATYNIDKLYSYKCALENELKEYLGINNMGLTEKKEHLISTEVEANNEVVASSGDCFFDVLVEFASRIKDLFGYEISVKMNKSEEYDREDYEEEEDEENV